ncbi:hypothetical protein PROFUN_02844 [Planoprotostelium fungivorum]|uniref:Uncharacterized protein n=1 Tax=Planoprotostelium fungivorum TaxID=1890364 RepID=A0A2P6NRV7_9EUKA|nr:hypothetical protein PROFUN_02844 [Planoprotostelium fungivorum]
MGAESAPAYTPATTLKEVQHEQPRTPAILVHTFTDQEEMIYKRHALVFTIVAYIQLAVSFLFLFQGYLLLSLCSIFLILTGLSGARRRRADLLTSHWAYSLWLYILSIVFAILSIVLDLRLPVSFFIINFLWSLVQILSMKSSRGMINLIKMQREALPISISVIPQETNEKSATTYHFVGTQPVHAVPVYTSEIDTEYPGSKQDKEIDCRIIVFISLSMSEQEIRAKDNSLTKRQWGEDLRPPMEESALNVVLSSKKATVIAVFRRTDWPFHSEPRLPVINDAAQVLMQSLLDQNPQTKSSACISFWDSVSRVARGENITREEIQLPEAHLSVRYKRIEEEDITVVITAKRAKENANHRPTSTSTNRKRFQSNDLGALIEAVEEDVIGHILGLQEILLFVVEIGLNNKFLGGNRNSARLFQLENAQQVRGKTFDLEQSAHFNKAFSQHLNPDTMTSRFPLRMGHSPGLFFFCLRQILPNIYLGLSMGDTNIDVPPPLHEDTPQKIVWTRAKWDTFMEDCIRHIQNNPQYGSTTRMTLPGESSQMMDLKGADAFYEHGERVFCYAYTGLDFIPSGNSDGYLWRSSRGAICSGNLKRTYFYTEDPKGRKFRRRVMWLEDVRGVQMVEYRHFEHHGNTSSEHLLGPSFMDWSSLFNLPQKHESSPIDSAATANQNIQGDRRVKRGEMREDKGEDKPSNDVTSYVNNILTSWELQFGL